MEGILRRYPNLLGAISRILSEIEWDEYRDRDNYESLAVMIIAELAACSGPGDVPALLYEIGDRDDYLYLEENFDSDVTVKRIWDAWQER